MAFKATDYLITPSDILHLVRKLFQMSLLGWVKLAVLAGVYFLARHYGVEIVDGIFLTFFIGVFLYDIDARISISSALVLLVAIVLIMLLGPYTEFVNETTWPEAIAVWVYYFLAIGVLKQMKDMYVGRHEEEEMPAQSFEEHFSVRLPRKPTAEAFAVRDEEAIPDETFIEEEAPVTETVSEADPEALEGNARYVLMKKGNRVIIHYREK